MKLALVTGGAQGIGRHLVHRFCEAGYSVAFADLAGAEAIAHEEARMRAAGHRALGLRADAGSEADVCRVFDEAAAWHGGPPDVLVNNAGVQTWAPLLELEAADWERVIRTNLTGCFLNTREAGRRMAAGGRGGAIVNIGSGCNKLAFPRLVDYTASKGGVEQFTKSAAVELGPLGITVNCVAPGAIATERTGEEAPDYAASWAPLTPLGRVGTPDDVADVVLFFASPAARFVTGQTLAVDGGLFIRAPWPYA